MKWHSETVKRGETEAVGSTQLRFIHFRGLGPFVLGTVHQASVLNETNVSDFARDLRQFMEKYPDRNLLLCFKQVAYLSSTVLTELMRAHKGLQAQGGGLSVCSLRDTLREVFSITNFDKAIRVFDSPEHALKSVSAKPDTSWLSRFRNR
ncbi:MAG: STAS domain-containing protein [Candidatus Hydrogenedentes bacterium]|nr:STAS domain-containing protein [Candidatus Hydrogenedentota bacterium]